ncbi:hypothetical protein CHISP_2092 [Chitinispirillum alkaliphilum]|nr:hypothetical protein CHISP_2092 [Chitinispirillum alkaliphilum]
MKLDYAPIMVLLNITVYFLHIQFSKGFQTVHVITGKKGEKGSSHDCDAVKKKG